MVSVGDFHGTVWLEPMQKKATKSSCWKSVKRWNMIIASVWQASDILEWWKSSNHVLASKFKSIRLSFSLITTPFTGNAQLHLCSTVWVLSIKMTSSPFQISQRMTHYFVKRAKRATDLFKTFNLTIELQKTADGFWNEHILLLYFLKNNRNYDIILSNPPFQRSKK